MAECVGGMGKEERSLTLSSSIRHYKNKQSEHVDLFTIEYRQKDDGTYTLWCIAHPRDPYGKDASVHHLYRSGEICVTHGREPRSMEHAEAIAFSWMLGWSEYVRTGTFPNRGRSMRVPDRDAS